MNKLLMQLLSNYKRIFDSNLTPKINIMNYSKKLDEFDQILSGINQEITYNKFPLLFDYLIKTKQININQPYLHCNIKKVYTPLMKDFEEKNEIKTKNKTNKEKYELMSKEALIEFILKTKGEQLSDNNQEKKIAENDKENKDDIINELKNKVNRLNVQLNEQIKKNNKYDVIIGAQNRKINRLQRESANMSSILETFEGITDKITLSEDGRYINLTNAFGDRFTLRLENYVDNLIMDYVWGI
jgi:hypothetical protein